MRGDRQAFGDELRSDRSWRVLAASAVGYGLGVTVLSFYTPGAFVDRTGVRRVAAVAGRAPEGFGFTYDLAGSYVPILFASCLVYLMAPLIPLLFGKYPYWSAEILME